MGCYRIHLLTVFLLLGLQADLGKSLKDGKSIIIEGTLVNHRLLEHIEDQRKDTVAIVVPFLLTLSDTALSKQWQSETNKNVLARVKAFQSLILQENEERQRQGQPCFHVMPIDMDNIESSIDAMQSIVLERIRDRLNCN